MNLLYAVSATGNPLYRGRHELRGRYATYGQHAFIYDLVVASARRGVNVTVAVQGISAFPLTAPLRRHCTVIDADGDRGVWQADLILVDEPSAQLFAKLPSGIRTLCVVHKKGAAYDAVIKERCDGFICMTEGTVEYQARNISRDKLIFARHGVDLQRFHPTARARHAQQDAPQVLFSSRLDRDEAVMWQVIEELLRCHVQLTVLGDGDAFWAISDRFGDQLTLINHIPCHSVHTFLHHFDLVVSAGRGVMEALASGLPALAAGFDYGGPVLPENIDRHLAVNMTGFSMGRPLSQLREDVQRAGQLDQPTCRGMAEQYCSIDTFLDTLAIGIP